MTAINANPDLVVPPVIIQTPAPLTLDETNNYLQEISVLLKQLLVIQAWSAPNGAQDEINIDTWSAPNEEQNYLGAISYREGP